MRMVDLISKKRHNIELTTAEIEWIINGYTNKEIPDYQMSALLMAIVFNDMSKKANLDSYGESAAVLAILLFVPFGYIYSIVALQSKLNIIYDNVNNSNEE